MLALLLVVWLGVLPRHLSERTAHRLLAKW